MSMSETDYPLSDGAGVVVFSGAKFIFTSARTAIALFSTTQSAAAVTEGPTRAMPRCRP